MSSDRILPYLPRALIRSVFRIQATGRLHATVLSADIVGFTQLSGQAKEGSEELTAILNRYFAELIPDQACWLCRKPVQTAENELVQVLEYDPVRASGGSTFDTQMLHAISRTALTQRRVAKAIGGLVRLAEAWGA